MSVKLKINLPDRTVSEQTAARILLPIANGTLTIIEERAPTMQLLSAGVVALLDEENKITHRWFINGGLADVALDYCKIAVEEAVDLNNFTLDTAETKAKEHPFYQKVYEYLKAFG